MSRRLRNSVTVAIILIGWLVLVGSVGAGEESAPETIEPLHVLKFAESSEVQSVVIHPDDERAFVLLHAETINFWRVLVWYWPEILGGLAAFVGLTSLWFLWRIGRRRRIVGEPYCRKCDYCLTGMVAGSDGEFRCPECGWDLSRQRVRKARRMRVRLAMPMGALLFVTLGYGGMWVAGVPRDGAAVTWFFWRSDVLLQIGRSPGGAWLSRFEDIGDLLMEVDLESGEPLRRVYAHAGVTFFRMEIAPDGESVFIGDAMNSGVIQVSTESGRILSRFDLNSRWENFEALRPAVIGFHEDEPLAYVAYGKRGDLKTYVVEWNLATSAHRVLLSQVRFGENVFGAGLKVDRIFQYVPGSGGRRFISSPNFMESMETHEVNIWFHDVETGEIEKFVLGSEVAWGAVPVIRLEDRRAFVRSRPESGIIGVDLDERRILGSIPTTWSSLPTGWMSLVGHDRYLVLPSDPPAIYLRDLVLNDWVACLTVPATVDSIDAYPSKSGRWVVGIGQRDVGQGVIAHDLVIWDLRAFMDGREEAEVEVDTDEGG